jgi:DNA-binding NtrC family response regulator
MDGATNDATRNPTQCEKTGASCALLVVDEDGCERHLLPAHGTLTVGRGADADIRVKRPWISRRHAVLRLGEGTISIEDAASSCGTRVRGETLEDGAATEIGPGDVVELGSTMLVLQRRTGKIHDPRTLVAELREDCARAMRLGLEVDVVAIGPSSGIDGTRADLALALVGAHSISRLARIEETSIAVAIRAASGAQLAARVAEQLAARGMNAAIGSATFPRDADRAETLLARAMGAFATLGDDALVFADDVMVQLVAQLERLALASSNLILEGETGVGKDALAHLFHVRSGERGPLVRVSCARLDESDVVAMATAGTVVLGDIDAASPELQAELLATLFDERRGCPRVVATTQRDIASCTHLRRDLFFRLGVHMRIPPLRERPTDIEALTRRFLARASTGAGRRRTPELSPELASALLAHPWPGNVRELKDALAHAVAMAGGTVLEPSDMPRLQARESAQDLRAQLAVLERQRIVDALSRCGGNQSRAAKELGMPRNTLLARIREYGLSQPRKRHLPS